MTDNSMDLISDGTMLPLVEDFYTVQGEGFHAGKPAYFIRLGGCDVGCRWCDAKNTWNPKIYPPVAVNTIVDRVIACPSKAIVITGGEPLLYELSPLTSMLKSNGVELFLETSGTQHMSGYFDWVCLSPKRQQPPLDQMCAIADELKVIIQTEDDFKWAEESADRVPDSTLLYLQPEWSVYNKIIGKIVEYVKNNPKWNISIQAHKFMKIP